jgi:NAD(P)-dependent dehydrogenase (short-subunit alcohol dehydrogenase family)
MDIAGSIVLVTGANRGLGAAFCRALLKQGAAKVYGGARNPDSVVTPGVIPIQLDVTSPTDIEAAAKLCSDTTILINNAGISGMGPLCASNAVERARHEFETNVFGPLATSGAFAPVLKANGGGAIVNVLSVLSWVSSPGLGIYCASKAATWSLTNGLRLELLPQSTHVMALHVGLMDTDMTAGMDAPKSSPDDVVAKTLAALGKGAFEVLADDVSHHVRSALSADLTALYPAIS